VTWFTGSRGPEAAEAFMTDLASRVVDRLQLTTDGHGAYVAAVDKAFAGLVDYAMLVKIYGDPQPYGYPTKTTPAECISAEKHIKRGSPDPKHICTSFVEHQNLTIRMSQRRVTRLANAFSKKKHNHCMALALHFTYYNFVRIHQTLKATPAMAAGLADRPWPLADLVGLLEAREASGVSN
jgi:hypothetical protein